LFFLFLQQFLFFFRSFSGIIRINLQSGLFSDQKTPKPVDEKQEEMVFCTIQGKSVHIRKRLYVWL